MTLKEFYRKFDSEISKAVYSALKEDKVNKDITTRTVLSQAKRSRRVEAVLLCKQPCIAAGIDIFKRVYLTVDPEAKFKFYSKDGDNLGNKQRVLTVKTTISSLLAGERTALNFVQRMSGIATLTNYFVKRLRFKGSKVLHTRKTTPNFKLFELAAVKIGGGEFHRIDLSSGVLIKDNHILSSGSIRNILHKLKKRNVNSDKNEIEVKTEAQLQDVVNFGRNIVDTVMLDNFSPQGLKNAVTLLKRNGFKIEVSGGINRQNFIRKQIKGIDYYSIGMLTHSYESADFSLEF